MLRGDRITAGKSSRPITALARTDSSEPWIDGLALEREDTEAAFVHAAKRLFTYEPVERFDSERELARSERALRSETASAKPLEVLRLCVLGSVDDAQVFAPADLERGLREPTAPVDDEVHRLDDHALATGVGQLLPPRCRALFACGVGDVNGEVRGCMEELLVFADDPSDLLHMPGVRLVHVDRVLAREQMEGRELQVGDLIDGPAVPAVGIGVAGDVGEARPEYRCELGSSVAG